MDRKEASDVSSPRQGLLRELIYNSVSEFLSKGWCIFKKNWRMLFFTPNVMASLVSSLWAEYLNRFEVCPFCELAWHNLLVCQQ